MSKYLKLSNYINFLINKIYILLLPFIKKWNQKYYKKYSNQPLKHQPIFIIGAPRTGSTILYQTLTNQLDVLYVDNLTCRFNKTLFFGFWLSHKLFRQKAHNCFRSNHGDTSRCGLHAPSECGIFWYRWLPTDRHFIDYNDITNNMIEEIRKEITAVINYFDKPIVFKNLNMGQRIRLLKECFPEAKFIFIKREPLFTAQSILKAKRKLGVEDEFWSIMPSNVKELRQLGSYEQIIKQIFYLEKQITEDKNLFDNKFFLDLNYKQLGDCFDDTLNICQEFIGTKGKDIYQKADIQLTEKILLKDKEILKLQEEINKLDWDNYNDK